MFQHRLLLRAFALGSIGFATFAHGEPLVWRSGEAPAQLVELFTSEGCSSCPPAEAWMSALKTSPELWTKIIPVVFHVDYWDRLGWPDRFASAAFTERQRRYAAAWGGQSVYTPGFVVGGREWRGWFQRAPLPAPSSGPAGRLTVTLSERTRVEVVFELRGPAPAAARVEVALLGGDLVSKVARGENGGRQLRHDFVVVHHAAAALQADGPRWIATVHLPAKPAEKPVALAAWVTSGEARPPLQAVGGWWR